MGRCRVVGVVLAMAVGLLPGVPAAAGEVRGAAAGPVAEVVDQQQHAERRLAARTGGRALVGVREALVPQRVEGVAPAPLAVAPDRASVQWLPEERFPAASPVAGAGSGAAAAEEGDGGPHGSWTVTIPQADLDGDGGRDLVAYDLLLDTRGVRLTALSGGTGAVRWTVEAPGLYGWVTDHDLTGDGLADLVEVATVESEVVREEGCDPDGWSCTTYEVRWTDVVRVRSGADGAVVWAHPVAGGYRSVIGEDGSESAYDGAIWAVRVEGGVVAVDIATSSWSQAVQRTDTLPLLLGEESVTTSMTDRFDVVDLDPATGHVLDTDVHEVDGLLFLSHHEDGSSLVEAYHRPTRTETCTVGLLALTRSCTQEGDPNTYTVAVERGGERTWVVESATDFQVAYWIGGDLDGDTVEDVALIELASGAALGEVRREVVLLGGADGTSLLREATAASAIGLPGEGPADTLLMATYDDDRRELRLARRAADLRTDATVSTHGEPQTDAESSDAFIALDVDPGDPASGRGCALLLAWQVFESPTGSVHPHSAHLSSEGCTDAVRRTGPVILDGDHLGFRLGDVVGDGALDVVTAPSYLAGPASAFAPSLVDGGSGQVRWTAVVDGTYGFADVIGRDRVALVVDEEIAPDTYRSTTTVVDGDGAARWSHVSP